MSILISVAHSSKAQGAVEPGGVLTEYRVSMLASEACYRTLAGEYAVELFDCGPLSQSEYDNAKIARVNTCMPDLAIEIHCNSGGPAANYSEVIYADAASPARSAAACIAESLRLGFSGGNHKHWKSNGARVDDRGLFFLQKTKCPALIVEGLFISNLEQAIWLASGGAGVYGALVASGIKQWLGMRK
jgi:N-acetylmuramoyl-L-alanine amidase